MLCKLLAMSLTVSSLMTAHVYAAEGDDAPVDINEVARQLANPNTNLGVLAFPLDYIQYQGDIKNSSSQSAMKLSFQPSLPYKLNDSMNLFFRPLVPVIFKQPVTELDENNELSFTNQGIELGDISFDVAVGKTFQNGVMAIAGIVGTLPTATDDSLSLDQTLLGPEFLVGYATEKFVVGTLFTQQWDVAGEDSFDTSITGGQYFYTINLADGWQIQAQPTWSYNHNAQSGQELTFPIGTGLSKTLIFNKTPWKVSVQYWHYLEQPDAFGPDYQIRFQFAPVVPLPW
ncbi:hypothetical protein [Thalassotalea litorea]|uniref:hypothetical protein n=1 Tax=Thalassotalea litorea TaxID=2020715 RepID=UPI003735B6CB